MVYVDTEPEQQLVKSRNRNWNRNLSKVTVPQHPF